MESYLSDIQDVRASICQVFNTFKRRKNPRLTIVSIENILGILFNYKICEPKCKHVYSESNLALGYIHKEEYPKSKW